MTRLPRSRRLDPKKVRKKRHSTGKTTHQTPRHLKKIPQMNLNMELKYGPNSNHLRLDDKLRDLTLELRVLRYLPELMMLLTKNKLIAYRQQKIDIWLVNIDVHWLRAAFEINQQNVFIACAHAILLKIRRNVINLETALKYYKYQ
ncbi:hypothetical protein Bhyg_14879 [Pseudolycoriella hygida]|uniref:Uncharacterized protein n=1 Tax=Pseudolycoriella hygida TaxID=35572 RepID=A0A9Q0MQU0_9DIPT|nr:hypothetical protein Bhyg_14879 [Pseudolycoriella hygida]